MSSTNNIAASLGNSTSLALLQAQAKRDSLAQLLSTSTTSKSNSSDLVSILETGLVDMANISAVGSALGAVSKAAAESGSDKAMKGVAEFVKSLQDQGTDTLSILTYLNKAKEMAKSDPAGFVKLFTASEESEDSTQTTTDASTETASDASDSASSTEAITAGM